MGKETTTAIVPKPASPVAQATIPPPGQPAKKITDGLGAEIAGLIHLSGTIELTGKQEKTIFAPVNEKSVEIRPDGLIYLPWMEYVTRLKETFGIKWTLLPEGLPKTSPSGNSILWGFWLVIEGRPYGFAIGEQEYYPENKTMSWSDACEGAKSNALMRVCKGIGISLELWRPSFIRDWKKKHAHKILSKDRYGNPKTIWAKKDTEKPAENEEKQDNVMPKKEEIKEASSRLPKPKNKINEPQKPMSEQKTTAKPKKTEQTKAAITPVNDDKERVIESIRGLIAEKTFDPKHFKIFLYNFAKDHKVKFVERNQFKNLSFHEGDYNDLQKLLVHFDYMSAKYLDWAKTYQPKAKEDSGTGEEEPPF